MALLVRPGLRCPWSNSGSWVGASFHDRACIKMDGQHGGVKWKALGRDGAGKGSSKSPMLSGIMGIIAAS
jgi:hypothetical protein